MTDRRIYVFVDPLMRRLDPSARDLPEDARTRRPFLPDRIAKLGKASQLREISVYEHQQAVTTIDISNASHLLVSWDAANGDSISRSDITLQFFVSEGRVRAEEVLQEGGTLFCESQTVEGLPVQATYDGIFGPGELTVSTDVLRPSERCGSRADVRLESAQHPLLQGMNWQLQGSDPPGDPRLFFLHLPEETKASLDRPIMDHYRDSLWIGWFTSWSRDWIPLLYAAEKVQAGPDASHRAILLAKVRGHGLLLASTLWVAALRQDQLLRNILEAPVQDMTGIRRFHRQEIGKRNRRDLSIIGALFTLLVGLVGLLAYSFFTNGPAVFKGIASFLGVSAAAFGASLIVFAWRHVWKRPHGLGIIEFYRIHRIHRRLEKT
jgi:hypothetical protein